LGPSLTNGLIQKRGELTKTVELQVLWHSHQPCDVSPRLNRNDPGKINTRVLNKGFPLVPKLELSQLGSPKPFFCQCRMNQLKGCVTICSYRTKGAFETQVAHVNKASLTKVLSFVSFMEPNLSSKVVS